ncbi:MAG: polymer-forming cytoskeletal protein [Rhodospirillales bacterium]|nr:polymer-forming cytoskeletal protein [Rhodospirillales bacterium]MDP6643096.1 polymer-forming cytoskeletal protein [Rhodospirillales bacterium]MDP6841991.1 polymer-forming cytoskeletal protein [Rhodospirillales bacterium]
MPPAPKTPAPPSLLSTDLKITGDIVSQGEIQVDGQIDGDIHTDVLIVGETAQINGEISADNVRVHGYVTGQIKARAVSLAKSAHVLGDILHENLAIEQGALLEGHCRRIEGHRKESEGMINLLVKGGAKSKSEPPPKKAEVESA